MADNLLITSMCKVPVFADITVLSLGGRPSTYSQATTAAICTHISKGSSLRKVCLLPGMPSKATVMRWLAAHEEFRVQYQFACWWRAQELIDEIMTIADDASRDIIYDAKGRPRPNWVVIRRARLRISVRMWLYAIWEPRKYNALALV